MLKIRLSEQDSNNLKIFLERVDLKGSEVLPFITIINAINNAETEKLKEVSEEPKKEGD